MSVKKPIGDPNVLQKRLVANPRYEGIGVTVNTGITVNTAKALKESEVSVKPLRDELFRRMRPSTLANLLNRKLHQAQLEGQLAGLSPSDREQLRMAMGEPSDAETPAGYPLPRTPQKEVLVLDLREREEYDQCHIGSAIHYPATRLSRSTNPFPMEVLSFRGKPNSIVVLYDLEEELVVQRKAGNVFVERGFDNAVVLSGGLKEFVQEHGDLIVGESPVPIVPKPQAVIHGRRLLASRQNSNVGGGASTLGTSMASSHKPKSLSTSLARRQEAEGAAWR